MLKMDPNKKVKICSSNNISITEVTDKLTFSDIMGSFKARLGINRMNFKVSPGLYSLGKPDSNSPVMVTENYKMSFDDLRKELMGINTYILVLDTKGVNVWCAASKETFGTNELVNRIKKVNLSQVVVHKNLILPQLSATGISAYEVQKKCGFKVVYGPIRAGDIPYFINAEIQDKDSCMECGACAKNCPFSAIEVKNGTGCAQAIIIGKLTGSEPTCGCFSDDNSCC